MDPRVLLSALRARIGLFAAALLGTLSVALAISLAMPKVYRASVSLLLAESPSGGGFVAPQERMAYLQTQADLLSSDEVVQRAVERLRLADDPAATAAWSSQGTGQTLQRWLAQRLQDGLRVDTAQSSVIRVAFDGPDPTQAAAAANALAQAYVDAMQSVREHNAHQAEALFDAKLARLRADLERAQAALGEYMKAHGIVAADERNDIEQAQLAALSAQLARAKDQALEAASRRQQAHKVVGGGLAPEHLADVQASPTVQRLGADLAQGEARLQELAQHYGAAYPLVQRQAAENQSRRAALGREAQRVIAAIDNAAEQASRRSAELEAAVAAQRERLLARQSQRSELVLLANRVELAQRTLDAAQQKFAIGVAEYRVGQTPVTVLGHASPPKDPLRPKLALNLLVALAVGALLGAAAVAAREMSDRRVRSDTDLIGRRVAVIGTIGHWRAPPGLQRQPPLTDLLLEAR